jgi:hypothetical protein
MSWHDRKYLGGFAMFRNAQRDPLTVPPVRVERVSQGPTYRRTAGFVRVAAGGSHHLSPWEEGPQTEEMQHQDEVLNRGSDRRFPDDSTYSKPNAVWSGGPDRHMDWGHKGPGASDQRGIRARAVERLGTITEAEPEEEFYDEPEEVSLHHPDMAHGDNHEAAYRFSAPTAPTPGNAGNAGVSDLPEISTPGVSSSPEGGSDSESGESGTTARKKAARVIDASAREFLASDEADCDDRSELLYRAQRYASTQTSTWSAGASVRATQAFCARVDELIPRRRKTAAAPVTQIEDFDDCLLY